LAKEVEMKRIISLVIILSVLGVSSAIAQKYGDSQEKYEQVKEFGEKFVRYNGVFFEMGQKLTEAGLSMEGKFWNDLSEVSGSVYDDCYHILDLLDILNLVKPDVAESKLDYIYGSLKAKADYVVSLKTSTSEYLEKQLALMEDQFGSDVIKQVEEFREVYFEWIAYLETLE
jgi:hypothetical protein